MVKKYYTKMDKFNLAMAYEERNRKRELAFQERQKKYREKIKDEESKFSIGDSVEVCCEGIYNGRWGNIISKRKGIEGWTYCIAANGSNIYIKEDLLELIMSQQEKDDIINEDLDSKIKNLEEQLAKLKALKESEKWKFTEDEKVILRNLPEEYKWIVRDMNGELYVFIQKPRKNDIYWCNYMNDFREISMFNHLFQCIQWENEKPCEFRKFI